MGGGDFYHYPLSHLNINTYGMFNYMNAMVVCLWIRPQVYPNFCTSNKLL